MGQAKAGHCRSRRFGDAESVGCSGFRKDQGKLLAAKAGDGVDLPPGDARQFVSQQNQVFIAAAVALGVVQRLEMVSIENHQ